MSVLAILLAGAAASPLDPLMLDVTEACVLPDLGSSDPNKYLVAHGWKQSKAGLYDRVIDGVPYRVEIEWPSTKETPAGCSFDSEGTPAIAIYEWFKDRIGDPSDIPWNDKHVGGWRINTNGHDVGIYVSRKATHPTASEGMMLHILQH